MTPSLGRKPLRPLLVACMLLLGCSTDDPAASDPVANDPAASVPAANDPAASVPAANGVAAPEGITVSLVVEGLDRPTQLFVGESEWLVAQLGGGENEGRGQVISIDPERPIDRVVLIDGLNKPTGVARFDGDLWVMEADRLLRFDQDRLSAGTLPLGSSDASVAAGPLPNNGRSHGSLTVVGDRLLFDSSGSQTDGVVVAESGRLWSIDTNGNVAELASGFKHAYAHAALPDGSLVVTEISDGLFDGEPAADALVPLIERADHGWPRCVPDASNRQRRPVEAFGATAEECALLPPMLAVFDVGATPTSVSRVPWDDGSLAVVLWNPAEIVTVALSTGVVSPFVSSAQLAAAGSEAPRPQHLVVDGERLLVVDHDEGRIVALAR